MLDVPVDERAKKQIALWERCQRRDAEKAAAVGQPGSAGACPSVRPLWFDRLSMSSRTLRCPSQEYAFLTSPG